MVKRNVNQKRVIPKRTAEAKAGGYKIERGISKPRMISGTKSVERVTLEKMKIGQSFAFTDRTIVKRVKDICYRLKQDQGRRYSVWKMDNGWRAFRDA